MLENRKSDGLHIDCIPKCHVEGTERDGEAGSGRNLLFTVIVQVKAFKNCGGHAMSRPDGL